MLVLAGVIAIDDRVAAVTSNVADGVEVTALKDAVTSVVPVLTDDSCPRGPEELLNVATAVLEDDHVA